MKNVQNTIANIAQIQADLQATQNKAKSIITEVVLQSGGVFSYEFGKDYEIVITVQNRYYDNIDLVLCEIEVIDGVINVSGFNQSTGDKVKHCALWDGEQYFWVLQYINNVLETMLDN